MPPELPQKREAGWAEAWEGQGKKGRQVSDKESGGQG